jgi:extradiol dioxygenase family protein
MFTGNGIHHIAAEVKDVTIMRQFYQEVLEFNKRGIIVELTQMVDPVPRPIRKDFR